MASTPQLSDLSPSSPVYTLFSLRPSFSFFQSFTSIISQWYVYVLQYQLKFPIGTLTSQCHRISLYKPPFHSTNAKSHLTSSPIEPQASPRPASPLTSGAESGPDSKSAGAVAASGSSVSRPSSPTPPGGPRAAMRRRAAADHKESLRNARPASTRSAGAGGSSGTMLKLYTDESPGLRVDPVVVLVLSLGFIFSVVGLHGKNGFNIPDTISKEIEVLIRSSQSSPRSPASSPHKRILYQLPSNPTKTKASHLDPRLLA